MKTSVLFISCLLLLSSADHINGLALVKQGLSINGHAVGADAMAELSLCML